MANQSIEVSLHNFDLQTKIWILVLKQSKVLLRILKPILSRLGKAKVGRWKYNGDFISVLIVFILFIGHGIIHTCSVTIFSSNLSYHSSSLSKICTPKPGPLFFSLVIMSLFSFISSTCSVRKSDSRKSQKWGSLFFVPDACKSKMDWLTVFSSSKADSNASNADPHSSLFGLATSLRTTLPPRLFYKNKLTFSRLCNKKRVNGGKIRG